MDEWSKLSTISTFDSGSNQDDLPDNRLVFNQQLIRHGPHVSTPASLLIQSLVHQLCLMIKKDHNRATALYKSICDKLYEMKLLDENYGKGEFEIMRSQYQRALFQLMELSNNPDVSINVHSPWPIPSTSIPNWSRYYSDFLEMTLIAKGGFGSVFKARNNIDGIEYAVKKVEIQFKDINSISNHLSEVQTLASLCHPNIVSYKSAWLEPLIKYKSNNALSENINNSSHFTNSEQSSSYLVKNSENSDLEICFEESNKKQSTKSTYAVKTASKIEESIENCRALCKLDNFNSIHLLEDAHVDINWATLYIQMVLCDKTLKTWLEERNCQSFNGDIYPLHTPYMQESLHIFSQVAKGLHYIHNREIIHHDIKPSNIFIGNQCGSLSVQLGDFGLACPQQKVYHKGAIGTCLYAAPEQLKGVCHIKNDIYSIGLILSELVEMLGTDMEKVKYFEKLRNGNIPIDITTKCPKIAQIIKKSLENDVNDRADIDEVLILLKSLKESKDEKIRTLEEENIAKDEEIAKLKELLAMNKIIY